ncbi:MAG: FAD-dependent oxidoreductase [Candidatus Geothermincolia bacterium]
MKDCDVAVIGAGLGGLSAAAALTKAGKSIVLLEPHNVPGGYASSFCRGRFEFEISLHELSGLGHQDRRGSLYRLLEELDVARRVDFVDIPDFYRSVFPDLDIVVPCDRRGFEQTLTSAFPGDADGIRRIIELAFEIDAQVMRFSREGQGAMMRDPGAFAALLANTNTTLAEVLDRELADERSKAVLAQLWGYYATPPSRLSFLLFCVATADYLKFGPCHIRGKSQALSQAFVDAIEERGGDVRLNTGASRILTDGGRVRGVLAADGSEILADAVVCNANPFVACFELMDPSTLPSWYLKRIAYGEIGPGIATVYLGLDATCEQLGLDHHEIAINTDYDLQGHWDHLQGNLFSDREVYVTPYNLADPDASPPGTANVVLVMLGNGDRWMKLSGPDYVEAKERMGEAALRAAEKIAPELRNHIEVMEIATPLTNMRYTGNLKGSYIGYTYTPQDTEVTRMPNNGPLPGLYFAGAWVRSGGGYETCIGSGYRAARLVLQELDEGGPDEKAAVQIRQMMEQQAAETPAATGAELAELRASVSRLHPSRLQLRVAAIRDETASARTIRLEPVNGELPYFRPGQYVNLFLSVNGVATSRPFSIASPPSRPFWDLTVRRMPNGFVSNWLLDDLEVGDVLSSTGPQGSFYHEPLMDSDDLVFLAGGSGITPFAGIIRDAAERDLSLSIHLIYGSRDPGDIIFADEMRELSGSALGKGRFKMDVVVSEPTDGWQGLCGLLDTGMISELVGDPAAKTFYLCGPAAMYELCEGALAELGVARRRVKREVYGPAPDVSREPGWPGIAPDAVFHVTEARSSRTIAARAGEPLMNSLEREGIVLPAVCRSGECSACRTRLVRGSVFAPPRVRLRYADVKSGYIHPCLSYPTSDLTIRL